MYAIQDSYDNGYVITVDPLTKTNDVEGNYLESNSMDKCNEVKLELETLYNRTFHIISSPRPH